MMMMVKRVLFLLAVFAFALTMTAQEKKAAAGTGPGGPAAKVWSPSDAGWKDAGIAGVKLQAANGDPDKGASDMYMKVSAGTVIPWHWHSAGETLYMQQGEMTAEMWKGADKHALKPGSFASLPARMIHQATCVSKQDCVFFNHVSGKFDIHFVDENGKEKKPAAAEKKSEMKKKT